MLRSLFLFVIFVSTSANNAYAYIDPGIGAIFLQGFVAVVAGVSLFFSRVRGVISKILGLKDKDDVEDNSQNKK